MMSVYNEIKKAMEESYDIFDMIAQKYADASNVIISSNYRWVGVLANYLLDSFSPICSRAVELDRLELYAPECIGKSTLAIITADKDDVSGVVKKLMAKNCRILVISNKPHKFRSYKKLETFFAKKTENPDFALSSLLNLFAIFLIKAKGLPIESLMKLQFIELPEYMKILMEADMSGIKKSSVIYADRLRYDLLIGFDGSLKAKLIEEYKGEKGVWIAEPRWSYVPEAVKSHYSRIDEDEALLINPFKFVEPKGAGAKNDVLLSPLYLLMVRLLLKSSA